jgi:chemotaxis protein methyltransferase CheR
MEDPFPSLVNGTNAMDLILCRNVLMYFTRENARKTALQFGTSLVDGGCLIFSPVEAPLMVGNGLTPVQFHGQTFFRKGAGSMMMPLREVKVPEIGVPASTPELYPLTESRDKGDTISVSLTTAGSVSPPSSAGWADPARLIEEGRYAEAAGILEDKAREDPFKNRDIVLLVRAYANQGDFERALLWCDRGIALDRLNPTLHYLHAIILGERGDEMAGFEALQRTLYLDPDLILASIALGSLERKIGRSSAAARHFVHARFLLEKMRPDDLVPESGGLTAGRLQEILTHAGGPGP